jgi:dipeptidyl-peptidase 4
MIDLRRLSLLFAALLLFATLSPAIASAQGSLADYQRAGELRSRTTDKVRNGAIRPRWIDEGKTLWYTRESSEGHTEYVVVDCQSGVLSPIVDLSEVIRSIGDGEGASPIVAFDGNSLYLHVVKSGETWRYDIQAREAKAIDLAEAPLLHLKSQSRVQRSRAGRGESSIVFVNGLEEHLSIYWVNEGGGRSSYGEVAPGETHEQHTFAGHAWVLLDDSGTDRAAFIAGPGGKIAWIGPETTRPGEERESPRKERNKDDEKPRREVKVFVREHNVWLRNRTTDEETALTTDGTAENSYGGKPHWSPDGTRVVVDRTVATEARKVYYVESAPRDQLQPKLHSYNYRKPGDPIPTARPHLFDVVEGREIPVDDTLFANPWSITNRRWSPDSSRFSFLFNQRGHQTLRVVSIDAKSGEARAIIDEKSETFIDYSQKQTFRLLEDSSEIIWSSERDGWNHLYLLDAKTGELKNRITSGEWVVRGIDRIDEEERQVWFRAGGIHEGQNPYHVHFARVNFDGSELLLLTEGDGTHQLSFSGDREYYIDSYSRVDLPPVAELRRAVDGSLVRELERADWSALLETGWKPPERFVAKGRDGVTDIWGIIRRPTNHDPAKMYPVIEYIYAGPHSSFVPLSFHRHSSQSEVAELGFIVVQIDGMGTNHRSKAFHDVCWKNLGDSGFPDRILWMEAAAKRDPSMDLSRVGIYGGSAGGQSALRALLAHGDFYHAAVTDCGCHDNRMDKIWWNEAWMGWPIGPHYEEQSNVTQAHRLEGKLLLVVGEMDENVDPASTMQVVDALIRADKDFDLLLVPGAGHGASESSYGRRRRRDFFVRNLLGVEPRWE